MKKEYFFIIGLLAIGLLGLHTSQTYADDRDYPLMVSLSAKLVANQAQLSWTKNTDSHFKFYELFKTNLNTLPLHGKDQMVWSTDDQNEVTHADSITLGTEVYYRLCVVNTDEKSSCSNVLHVRSDGSIKSEWFFKDLERSSWYEGFVEGLYQRGIVTTKNSLWFRPSGFTTRGELAEIIGRLILSDETKLTNDPFFCDVSTTTVQGKYINHLGNLKLIEGYAGGTCASKRIFKPMQSVNRGEALKMMMSAFVVALNAEGIKDDTYAYQDSDLFLDVHQSSPFAEYIARAKKDKVITGYPDDKFRPENKINRAEVAKIMMSGIIEYTRGQR